MPGERPGSGLRPGWVRARQRQPYSLRHCRPLLFTRGLAHSEQLVQLEKTPGTSWCPLISFHLSFGSFVSFSFSLSFVCSLFLPWKERKTQLRYRPRTAHAFLSPLVKTSMQKADVQRVLRAPLCPNLWDGSASPKCLPKAQASPSRDSHA